jgi:hypothetical protein
MKLLGRYVKFTNNEGKVLCLDEHVEISLNQCQITEN